MVKHSARKCSVQEPQIYAKAKITKTNPTSPTSLYPYFCKYVPFHFPLHVIIFVLFDYREDFDAKH